LIACAAIWKAKVGDGHGIDEIPAEIGLRKK